MPTIWKKDNKLMICFLLPKHNNTNCMNPIALDLPEMEIKYGKKV